MLNDKVLGLDIAVAGVGTSQESNISPFYPRHKVIAIMDMSDLFAGRMTIESSNTGLFAGEETTELDTGVLAATADKDSFNVEITLKKFMRFNMVSRTAGTGTAKLRSGM